MTTISLPVHPISRQILLKDYGNEPLYLKKQDLILQQLMYADPGTKASYLQSLLTETISIQVSERIGRLLVKRTGTGYHLFHYHIDRIIRYIECKTEFGAEEGAYPAMLEFYARYGLEDEMLSFDAMYKKWQRHKAKNPNICDKISIQSGHGKCQLSQRVPLTHDQVIKRVNILIRENLGIFYTKRGKLSQKMIKKTLLYAFWFHRVYTPEELAEIFGITKRNVYRHISTFEQLADTAPEIRMQRPEFCHS